MSLLLRSSRRRSRPSRGNPSASPALRGTPIGILTASPAGANLDLEFDQPISLRGTPAFTVDVAGAKALSATQVSETVVEILFDADISAATRVDVGYQDPAIRNATGGYVTATQVMLS